jgi:uncharacterized CHY-type Zn-finger protein
MADEFEQMERSKLAQLKEIKEALNGRPVMCGYCKTEIEISGKDQKCACGRCELVWKRDE